ncbi:glutamate racemase [Desulfovibrio sp.]|uniref:glutamate racemase n=1 Tax=Desulfovibrio sp. TaxID=885 RepID=UPI0025C4AE8D|nr:glutamate racemase [Desulfovibrio sp.]
MNQSSRLPVGLFDSGMGGLTVLKALNHRLPGEDLLYLGDTARLPYGTKGPDTIRRYTLKAAQKLVDMGVKMLVIACNTATAAALPTLRQHFAPLPVLGVVEPGAQAAAQASHNGHIVVLGTEATINGGAYQQAIARIRPEAVVLGRACNLFVPLAEEGWMDGPLVEGVARRYLQGLFCAPAINDTTGSNAAESDAPPNAAGAAGAPVQPDTLLLGCTHYPLLQGALRQVVGPHVRIVDSAAITAQVVAGELGRLEMLHPDTQAGADAAGMPCRTGQSRFLTTDHVARFIRTGSLFLGREMAQSEVVLVDL